MPSSGNAVRTETQTSAGGVALRTTPRGLEVALISVGDPPRWQLPKGLVDPGETPEVAAVREVREEAGIDVSLSGLIDKVEYWYQSKRGTERIRYHKFVNFYLMRYESGEVSYHDKEVHEARWFPVDEAVRVLAFRSEQGIVSKAIELARE
jgi:8-oxo-dGTP pyrophosphatase MutT (NUDIX family)